jgi:hypothetical protein
MSDEPEEPSFRSGIQFNARVLFRSEVCGHLALIIIRKNFFVERSQERSHYVAYCAAPPREKMFTCIQSNATRTESRVSGYNPFTGNQLSNLVGKHYSKLVQSIRAVGQDVQSGAAVKLGHMSKGLTN